ncbi:hypothetical protein MAPG_07291 [Magnaporthiopsis poae ATCC 64411]|uniref:Wax synthase domain-containing protein n=1 Tax=Magnaporthiopsis poae (strain ATCC 64411 / 73-15) TaxID=644358 RepID=A0A0C4E4A0_MAGP6|nr:hypothetical protein MAPG_07291 [Magnaporthiopsis poae ATCC 64411]
MDPIYHTIASSAPICFLTAFGCFYLAAHRRPGDHVRHVLGVLSILGVAAAGYIRGQQPDRDSAPTFILVMLSIAVLLRTFTLLFWKRFALEPTDTLFDTHKLRHVFVFWTTLITDKPTPPSPVPTKKDAADRHTSQIASGDSNISSDPESLPRFVTHTLSRLLTFWALDQTISHLVNTTTLNLGLTLDDFAPPKQGLVPPAEALNARELCLRAITSVNWIRATHLSLCAMREVLALLHVAVLRMLAAGWIFFSSSLCHAATGWVLTGRSHAYEQARFFLLNWVLCLLETVAGQCFLAKGRRRVGAPAPAVPGWRRVLGYVWVLGVFFALTPGWQYSAVYDNVLDSVA